MARLHGATVTPRLAKRTVTHVVCTQLSGTKEQRALRDASSAHAVTQYVVQPSWITESVAAGRRLQELRYSLMKGISQQFGLNILASRSEKLSVKPCRGAQAQGAELPDSRLSFSGSAPTKAPTRVEKRTQLDTVFISDSPARGAPSCPESPLDDIPATAPDSEDGTQDTELDSDAD